MLSMLCIALEVTVTAQVLNKEMRRSAAVADDGGPDARAEDADRGANNRPRNREIMAPEHGGDDSAAATIDPPSLFLLLMPLALAFLALLIPLCALLPHTASGPGAAPAPPGVVLAALRRNPHAAFVVVATGALGFAANFLPMLILREILPTSFAMAQVLKDVLVICAGCMWCLQ